MKNLFKVFNLGNRYSFAILVLRSAAGLALMFHGWGKIQNPLGWMGDDSDMPGILQALAAISEFFGGLCLVLGLFTPLAAFGILCTMAVAIHRHAIINNGPFVGKGGYELPLIYLCIMALLVFAGAGKFSLDRAIFGQKK